MWFFLIFEVLAFIIIVLLSFLIIFSFIRPKQNPPFISTKQVVLGRIVQEFAKTIDNNSVIYDLGSGDGRLLFELSKEFENSKFVGIEYYLLPFLISKYKNWKLKRKNLLFLKRNLYDVDITEATHIYTYLYPEAMIALLPQFERKFKRGGRLITLDFPFKNRPADNVIDLAYLGSNLGKKLYIYDF